MATTIKDIVSNFEYFYESLHHKGFVKTLKLNTFNERKLLPLVRCYLLGVYGNTLQPEACSVLPGSKTGTGFIDFIIDDVAVEFAVRAPEATKSQVAPKINATEIKKLMKFNGKALLVLFDFSTNPLDEDELNEFRYCPSLGKGNHTKSAFNLAYFYIESRRPFQIGAILKNIRV